MTFLLLRLIRQQVHADEPEIPIWARNKIDVELPSNVRFTRIMNMALRILTSVSVVTTLLAAITAVSLPATAALIVATAALAIFSHIHDNKNIKSMSLERFELQNALYDNGRKILKELNKEHAACRVEEGLEISISPQFKKDLYRGCPNDPCRAQINQELWPFTINGETLTESHDETINKIFTATGKNAVITKRITQLANQTIGNELSCHIPWYLKKYHEAFNRIASRINPNAPFAYYKETQVEASPNKALVKGLFKFHFYIFGSRTEYPAYITAKVTHDLINNESRYSFHTTYQR